MSTTSIADHYLSRLCALLLFVCLLFGATPARAADVPYVVQPGDTLSEIAKSHGTDVDTLRRLNGLGDVDFVWVGQQLHLPAPVDVAAVLTTAAETAATVTESGEQASDDSVDEAISDSTAAAMIEDQVASATEVTAVDSSPSATAIERTDVDASEIVSATTTLVDPAELADPVVSPTEKTDIYIVAAGDTLSQIAVRYQTTLAHLIEFNQISPAQRLKAGQAVVVPVAGEGVTAAAVVELARHVVQPGEVLSTIAKAYNLSTAALARANGIANAELIVPGQALIIPSSTALNDPDSIRMGSDGFHVHTTFPTATEKWIDVDLSEQRLVAYRGHKPVQAFIISSGLPGTPTVTGNFRIWAKTPLQDMYAGNRAAGYSYYIKDVPWVQYFYKDYGFHGAYWHNNFGHPMSHGCINMRNEDAKWLFDWASPTITAAYGWFTSDDEHPGTLVVIHD